MKRGRYGLSSRDGLFRRECYDCDERTTVHEQFNNNNNKEALMDSYRVLRANFLNGSTNSTIFVIVMTLFVTFSFSAAADADDRLVVKDNSGATTFTVKDDGTVVSDGRIGIGMASPSYQFEVSGNDALQVFTRFHDFFSNGPGILFQRALGTVASPVDIREGSYLGKLQFKGRVNTAYTNYAYFGLIAKDTSGNGYYAFQDRNKNNRLVIETTGNVGIGVDDPDDLLVVDGAYCNGSGWYTYSSRQGKANINDLSATEAVEALHDLNPVTFSYKKDLEEEHVGFIAEDVPDLVAAKSRKGINSMDIVAVLTKVVQEQQKTISEMNEKMVELERKLEAK